MLEDGGASCLFQEILSDDPGISQKVERHTFMMKHSKYSRQAATLMIGILLTTMVAFSSGCATTSARTQQARSALAEFSVKPDTAEKVIGGKELDMEDIIHLSSSEVNTAVIVEAIEDSSAVYELETSDIARLQSKGVDRTVIDALLASPHRASAEDARYSRRYYVYPYHRGFGHPFHHHRRYHYRGYYGYRCY